MPEIDRLDIAISAKTKDAEDSIDKLTKKLNDLTHSLNTVGGSSLRAYASGIRTIESAVSGLSRTINNLDFSKALHQLQLLSKIDLSNISKEKIKLNLDINYAQQKQAVDSAVLQFVNQQKAGARTAAQAIAKEYGIRDKQIIDQITSDMKRAADLAGNAHFTGDWESLVSFVDRASDSIRRTIEENGRFVNTEYSDAFVGVKEEYARFYDFIKSHRVRVSDALINDIGQTAWNETFKKGQGSIAGYYARNDLPNSFSLEEQFGNFQRDFPSLFPRGEIKNVSDQMYILRDAINKVREAYSKLKPVPFSELSTQDKESEHRGIRSLLAASPLAESARAVEDIERDFKNKSYGGSEKIILDVQIDEQNIQNQIARAINNVSRNSFEPLKLRLNVDTEELKRSLGEQLSGIDSEKLSTLANSLRALAEVSVQFSQFKPSYITDMVTAIATLGTVDGASISNVITGISASLSALGEFPDISGFARGLVDFAQSVSSLGNADLNGFLNAIHGLLNAISGLKPELMSGVADILPRIGAAIRQAMAELASAPSLDPQRLGQIAQILQSIPDMTKGATNITNNIYEANEKISEAGVNTGNLAGQANVAATNFSGLRNIIRTITFKTFGTAKGIIEKLTVSVKKLAEGFRLMSGSSKSLFASFTGLYFKFRGLIASFRFLTGGLTSAMDFTEVVNYFEVAVNEIGKKAKDDWQSQGYASAEEYANSFSTRLKDLTAKMTGFDIDAVGNVTPTGKNSLGINPSELMQYQAMFAQMANSQGLATETSLNMSKALTMLGADWASLRNVDFSDAWGKMASALAGQSRAVRAFGIDITNATLQEYAYMYGLDKKITKMSQAEKAQLRLLAILDQSKVAYGDLANTLESYSNQLRLLKQNLGTVARLLGNLFLPIVAKILPYMNALAQATQHFLLWIAKLLNINLEGINSSMSGMADDLADMGDESDLGDGLADLSDNADGAADSLDDATDSAEKLKNTILGFDELNVLNAPDDKTSSSSSSGSGSGDDAGAGIGTGTNRGNPILDNAIAKALADYEKAWNDAFSRMSNKTQELTEKIENFFKMLKAYFDNKDWQGLGAKIAEIINGGLQKIYDFLNWDKFKEKIQAFMSGLTETLNSLVSNIDFDLIGRVLGEGLNIITRTLVMWYEGFDWVNWGRQLAAGLMGFVHETDWLSLGKALGGKLMSMINTAYGFVSNLNFAEIGQAIGTAINGAISMIPWANLGSLFGKAVTGVFTALVNIQNTLNTKEIASGIETAITNAINEFDPVPVGAFFGNALNQVFDLVGIIAKAIDPVVVGRKLSTAVNIAVLKFDGKSAGENLRLAMGKIWDVIQQTVANINWEGIKQDLIGFLEGVFGETAGAFGSGFLEGLEGIIGIDTKILETLASAFGSLVDVINKSDPATIESVGKALGVFVGVVGTIKIGNNLASIATGLFGIATNAGGAASAVGAKSALGTAFTFLSNHPVLLAAGAIAGVAGALGAFDDIEVDWDGLKEKVSGAFSNIADSIGKIMENENVQKAGENIGTALGAIGQGLVWLTEGAVGLLADLVESFVKLAGITLEGLSIALNSIVDAVGIGLNYLSEGANALGQWVGMSEEATQSVANFQEQLDSAETTIDIAGLTAGEMVEAIRNGFSEIGGKLDYDYEKMGNLNQALANISGTGGDAFNQLLAAFESVGLSSDDLMQILEAKIPGAAQVLASSLDESAESAVASTDKIPAAIASMASESSEGLSTLSESLKTSFGDIGDSAEDAGEKAGTVDEVLNSFKQSGNITDFLKLWLVQNAIKNMAEAGDEGTENLGDLDTTLDNFKNEDSGFTDHMEEISEALTDAGVDADDFRGAVIDAIDSLNGDMPGKLSKISGSISDEAKNAKKESETLGSNVDEGIIAGIESKSSKVNAKSTSLAKDDVVGAMQKELQTHSPSKVAIGIGENWGEGLIGGMANKASAVNQASVNLAKNITDPFGELRTKLAEILREASTSLTNVMATMQVELGTSAQNIASSIANAFRNSGIAESMNGIMNSIQNALNYNAMYNAASNAAIGLANGFRSIRIPVPSIYISGWNSTQVGNSVLNIPNFSAQWYKNGGTPNTGDLFWMNENGYPELMYRKGNATQIDSNAQVMNTMRDVIYDTMMDILGTAEGLSGSGEETINNNIVVNLDGEIIERRLEKYRRRRNQRFSSGSFVNV